MQLFLNSLRTLSGVPFLEEHFAGKAKQNYHQETECKRQIDCEKAIILGSRI